MMVQEISDERRGGVSPILTLGMRLSSKTEKERKPRKVGKREKMEGRTHGNQRTHQYERGERNHFRGRDGVLAFHADSRGQFENADCRTWY